MAAAVDSKVDKTKTLSYDVAEQLRTPDEMVAYLNAWLAEAPDDDIDIRRAVRDVVRAFTAQRPKTGSADRMMAGVCTATEGELSAQRRLTLCALLAEGLSSGPAVADSQDDRDELDAIVRGDLA